MKKILCLPLVLMCFLVMTVKPVEAGAPAGLFIMTVFTGAAVAVTVEDCKTDEIGLKECAKKTWRERTDVPITQELYNKMYND